MENRTPSGAEDNSARDQLTQDTADAYWFNFAIEEFKNSMEFLALAVKSAAHRSENQRCSSSESLKEDWRQDVILLRELVYYSMGRATIVLKLVEASFKINQKR